MNNTNMGGGLREGFCLGCDWYLPDENPARTCTHYFPDDVANPQRCEGYMKLQSWWTPSDNIIDAFYSGEAYLERAALVLCYNCNKKNCDTCIWPARSNWAPCHELSTACAKTFPCAGCLYKRSTDDAPECATDIGICGRVAYHITIGGEVEEIEYSKFASASMFPVRPATASEGAPPPPTTPPPTPKTETPEAKALARLAKAYEKYDKLAQEMAAAEMELGIAREEHNKILLTGGIG